MKNDNVSERRLQKENIFIFVTFFFLFVWLLTHCLGIDDYCWSLYLYVNIYIYTCLYSGYCLK